MYRMIDRADSVLLLHRNHGGHVEIAVQQRSSIGVSVLQHDRFSILQNIDPTQRDRGKRLLVKFCYCRLERLIYMSSNIGFI